MNGYKIEISDILGSKRININTPIIILTGVPKRYLVPIVENSSVYNIDTEHLQDDLEKRFQFIERFIPIGQLYAKNRDNLKNTFTVVMANTRIIPTTRNFEEIKKNVWVGIIRKNDKLNRSLGTVYSKDKPQIIMPVFPLSFLKKLESDRDDISRGEYNGYVDTYSDPSYGRWVLNKYKFNVDKNHLKMIDSSGEISNMFIPTTPRDIIDDDYNDSDKKFSRKVYFTAQGSIVSDTNCIPPRDNMSRMSLNECNGNDIDETLVASTQQTNGRRSETNGSPVVLGNVMANDEGMLEMNAVPVYSDVFSPLKKSKLTKRGKTLVLKEKDEPWFTDSSVVGSAASIVDPHKITGRITTVVDGTVYDGTVYGDTDEDNASFISDCASKEPIIGYSRKDINDKCRGFDGIEGFESSDDSDTSMDYINNSIMYVMCIILIILLVYRFTDKKR